MWIEMMSADFGAVGPNSTNGVLKSLNVQGKSIRINTTLTGWSMASVMCRACRHTPAPSTAEASYSSVGIDCMPAVNIKNAKGQDLQIATTTIAQNALLPMSQNDDESVTWRSLIKKWLISPLSRWNMKLQVITPA